MQFKGRLKLPGDEGQGIAIDLRVEDIFMILSSDGELLGRWRVDDVGINRDYSNRFTLDLDGETMVFVADDALGFAYEGMTAIEDLSARLSKRKRRKKDRPRRLGAIFSRSHDEGEAAEEPDQAAVPSEHPEPAVERRPVPEPVPERVPEPDETLAPARPPATWMRPEAPAEPAAPAPAPVEDVDMSHPHVEVEAFRVDETAPAAAAEEPSDSEEPPTYADDASSWAVDVESIDLAGLYGDVAAASPEATPAAEEPARQDPPPERVPKPEPAEEEQVAEVTVEVERPRRRSRHVRVEEEPVAASPEPTPAAPEAPPAQEPEPPVEEPAAVVEPEVREPEVAEPAAEVTEPEAERESPAAPEPVRLQDASAAAERNGHERKSGFFRRRVKEVDHEHEYRESKTVGGITRKVCAICGHVSFAGEDVYQGWS